MAGLPAELHFGVDAIGSDGLRVGVLRGAVFNQHSLSLLAVIVQPDLEPSKAHLVGDGPRIDRVLPISMIGSATVQRLELTLATNDFIQAPV